MPLDRALRERASVRNFDSRPLDRRLVSQLLWALLGLPGEGTDTTTGATRTPPSAGGVYPLEVYLLEGGALFRYLPESHSLETVSGVVDGKVVVASTGQEFVGRAPSVFIIAASLERMAARYGERAERYVYLDSGHAAENLLLEATSLGLGAVPVGAFDDDALKKALGLPDGLSPVYVIPVGYPSR